MKREGCGARCRTSARLAAEESLPGIVGRAPSGSGRRANYSRLAQARGGQDGYQRCCERASGAVAPQIRGYCATANVKILSQKRASTRVTSVVNGGSRGVY